VVGCNRRVVFSDGKGVICGNTNAATFRRIEGYEDEAHAVDVLCLYDQQKKLKVAAITLACPAQSVTGTGLSAEVTCNLIGPEEPQVLVDRTVEASDTAWRSEPMSSRQLSSSFGGEGAGPYQFFDAPPLC